MTTVMDKKTPKALDSTGFCVCVLPLDFSVLTVSPPVSRRSA